jgi:hypothetical protein
VIAFAWPEARSPPEQLQKENAFIQNARECKIVDPNPAYRCLEKHGVTS